MLVPLWLASCDADPEAAGLARGDDLGHGVGDLRGRDHRDAELARAVRGFIIPTLRSIGLFSPRIETHFDGMFQHMGGRSRPISEDPKELPTDLEAWVNEGA